MPELIDANAIVGTIASSTSDHIANFAPVFTLIGGLLLAFGVGLMLGDLVLQSIRKNVGQDYEDFGDRGAYYKKEFIDDIDRK